ncbi:SDR family oxidoreductase [Sphingomonas lycopersici]
MQRAKRRLTERYGHQQPLGSDCRARRRGQKAYGAMTPLQCMADPSEIGAAAAFLASSDSSLMTASEIAVGGGLAQL